MCVIDAATTEQNYVNFISNINKILFAVNTKTMYRHALSKIVGFRVDAATIAQCRLLLTTWD